MEDIKHSSMFISTKVSAYTKKMEDIFIFF